MNKIIYSLILLLPMLMASGQQTFKESKLFSETIPLDRGESIVLKGERTFITLVEWDKATVKAEVEVISRHPNKTQARKDLGKIKVNFTKSGSTIYYNNALKIKSPEEKPKSNLKTILKLSVPSWAKVEVVNQFGELNISGAIERIQCSSQFSVTNLENYTGDMFLTTKYGNVSCRNTSGRLDITGNRSDVMLHKYNGSLKADLQYGKMEVAVSNSNQELNIKAEYSPVTLIVPNNLESMIELICDKCDINVDNCNIIADEKISRGKHRLTINGDAKLSELSRIISNKENITVISTDAYTNSKK